MRAVLIALLVVVALVVACGGGNGGGCADGFTKTCLADGTTCTCAPSCSEGLASCAQYALCGANHTCIPCIGPAYTGSKTTTTCRPAPSVTGCSQFSGGFSVWYCTGSDAPSDDPSNGVGCGGGAPVAGGMTEYCCSPTANQSFACQCSTNLCVPAAWVPGQSFTFQPLTSTEAGAPIPRDAAVGPVNP